MLHNKDGNFFSFAKNTLYQGSLFNWFKIVQLEGEVDGFLCTPLLIVFNFPSVEFLPTLANSTENYAPYS